MAELTAPMVIKNEEKRIVYGPVLIPDEPDTDDDVVSAEQIENVAHKFVEQYGNIDLLHSLKNVGNLVESYILPMEYEIDKDTIIPKGSWVMGVRVTDDESWQAVKDNKLGGFSIMAIQKSATKSAKKSAEKQRVTLADLGDDWIVNAVSLVTEPAVPKAKWIAIKSKASKDSSTEVVLDGKKIADTVEIDAEQKETVQKAIDGSLEHRRQLLRSKIREEYETEYQYPSIYSTMNKKVVVSIMDHLSSKERMFEIGYDISNNGEVTFTGTPEEVRIIEKVVPVNKSQTTESKEKAKESEVAEKNTQTDSVMDKLMKLIGFQSDKKVGEKMDKDKVADIVDEKVKPLNSKLDDLIDVVKQQATDDDDEGEEVEKSKKDDEESTKSTKSEEGEKDDEEETVEKSEYEAVLKELEKANKKPFSNRLTGQDGVAEKKKDEDKEDRDAFGFKIK